MKKKGTEAIGMSVGVSYGDISSPPLMKDRRKELKKRNLN